MNRIRDLRKERRLSQNDLAAIFKVSQQTISSYENGTREPDHETLIKLAEFFGVSLDYLLGQSDLQSVKEGQKNYSQGKRFIDISGLPDEAVRQVDEYVELMKIKYGVHRKKDR